MDHFSSPLLRGSGFGSLKSFFRWLGGACAACSSISLVLVRVHPSKASATYIHWSQDWHSFARLVSMGPKGSSGFVFVDLDFPSGARVPWGCRWVFVKMLSGEHWTTSWGH